jgi:ABC-type bacteriocin/lantibiotic exporter with double-glycine peptidase domain
VGVFVGGLLQVNQKKIIEKIQQQLFVRYAFQYAYTIPKLNMQEVDNYYLPELTNRFFDTVSLQKGITKLLLDMPVATIQIVFGLILLSFYHPVFIFFGLLLLLVLYLILRTTGNKGLETSLEESNYKYMVAAYLQEMAKVITSIKFSRESSYHLKKTDEYVTGYLKARTSHFNILLFQYWTLIGFKILITAAMLIVGAMLLVGQQLNVGQFIAAEIVILSIISSVEKVITNLDNVYDVLTSVEKINKLIEKPTEQSGTLRLEKGEKGISISVQDVSFGYESSKNTLNNITLDIAAGEKICITGDSGSGKSTLLRLLSGSYPNYSGNILVNEIPISNYDMNSIRANTGILLNMQDIIQGSVRDNICMGDNNISYEQLDELATLIGLKSFINSNKNGYEFLLQPSGQHLSGKIIKKILLLRALIHQPSLLLLEEPWLGLDEQHIQNIQDYLLSNRRQTTIVVTNNTGFAAKCNKVIFMKNGSINSIKTQ